MILIDKPLAVVFWDIIRIIEALAKQSLKGGKKGKE